MILKAKDIRKTFGPTIALDNAQVELKDGEVNALVGENGAGKSTILKAIAGVHSMDSGEIMIDGQKVDIHNTNDAIANGISIVFQESTINPFITIAENILLTDYISIRNLVEELTGRGLMKTHRKFWILWNQELM